MSRTYFRSSRPEVFCKKDVLKYFVKFTRKHLCLSLFFNTVAALKPATLLKKRLWHVLSCEFCNISKNTFSYRTPRVAASRILNVLFNVLCTSDAFRGYKMRILARNGLRKCYKDLFAIHQKYWRQLLLILLKKNLYPLKSSENLMVLCLQGVYNCNNRKEWAKSSTFVMR